MKSRSIAVALSLVALFGIRSFASAAETFLALETQLSADTSALEAKTNLTAAEKRRLKAFEKVSALLTNDTSEVITFRRLTRALTGRKFPDYQPLLTNAGQAVLENEWQRHDELINLIPHLPTIAAFTNTAADVRVPLAEAALASVTNSTRLSTISSRLLRADRAIQAELNRFATVLNSAVPSNSIRADWTDTIAIPLGAPLYGWALADRGYEAEGMQWILEARIYGPPPKRTDVEALFKISFVEGQTNYTISEGASCNAYVGRWFGPNYETEDLGEADQGKFHIYPLGDEYVVLFQCSGPKFTATTGLARLEKRYIGERFPEP